MKKLNWKEYHKDLFIPATMERVITKDIVFRPIKSWHNGSYAGEQIEGWIDAEDSSGCARIIPQYSDTLLTCHPPLSVTHRLYWHKKNPKLTISAILSYPNGLICVNDYLWETLGTGKEDVERFSSEKEMEKKIIKVLKRKFIIKEKRKNG